MENNTEKIQNDAALVDRLLEKDESALGDVEKRYGRRLHALSYRIVANVSDAEECVNDTFLEAWNRIPPDAPRDYLYPYLARIARHLSINRCVAMERLKRRAVISEFTQEMEECIPSQWDPDSHIDSLALSETISMFLKNQPKEKRILFMQRYFFLDSIAAISKRFGYSESKVKTTLFRMRNELKEYLKEEGYCL